MSRDERLLVAAAPGAGSRVPFVDLRLRSGPLRDDIVAAVGAVLDHGQFILGPEVERFERALAALCEVRHTVGVASGTDALILSLRALGIGPGDEVITVPNVFPATASAITLAGARPVFVDVREDLNLDPDALEAAVSPRTKAILVVHLTGRPADMHPVMRIAERHRLLVIEDCAQAMGARYHGQPVGSFGAAGCFSFHPLKVLSGCGDGGAVVTNDASLAQRLVKARNHGLCSRDECEAWGVNSRLDTLQATILSAKLSYLEGWIAERRAVAAFYRAQLAGIVRVPEERPHECCVYQTFVVQAERRDELQRHLARRGIETMVHYRIPLHLQEAARGLGYRAGDFPVAERLARTILSLPIWPGLGRVEQEAAVDAIRSFYG